MSHGSVSSISRLTGRVYAGVPAVVNREAKDAFIWSLPDNLRMSIAATNPVTISDCVANVSQLCSIMNIDETLSGWKKPVVSSINFSQDRIQKTPEEKKASFDKWVQTVQCWNCDKKGHSKAHCPEPIRLRNAPTY